MFKQLDPILHSPLRLAVMSLLKTAKEADFSSLREKTNATPGNLSVQVNKLKRAGYIDVTKQFKNNYPLTICKITDKGTLAFETYIGVMQTYMHPPGNRENGSQAIFTNDISN
jgi:DNA-binding transcriptional ArsR family regulator